MDSHCRKAANSIYIFILNPERQGFYCALTLNINQVNIDFVARKAGYEGANLISGGAVNAPMLIGL